MEPFNENETTSNLQRILIGVGTLIVVVLTVIVAIFLAMQEPEDEEPTPLAQISPTAPVVVITNTPTTAPPTFTATLAPPPTDTPSATPEPPPATTQAPPTATSAPVEPTFTTTPVVIIITPTPQPPQPDTGGVCQPPPSWTTYQVQVGDTLNSLSARTNVSVFDLQQVNCLESFTIRPGQVIYLPFTPPTFTPTPVPTPTGTRSATPTRTPTAIAPVISNVVPDRVDADSASVIITVIGRNFKPRESGFRVELRGPQSVMLSLSGLGSDTNFDAVVPPGLPIGTYDIVVTNANNRTGVRESAFIIGEAPPTATSAPGPIIDSVDPEEGFNNRDVTIAVRGRNFRPNEFGFQVQLRVGQDIRAELDLVGSASTTSFNAVIPAGLTPGLYDLWVINPDSQEDVEPAAYESLAP